jgi:hypothetical protein
MRTEEQEKELKQLVNDLAKKLIDQGKIIEAGWLGLKIMAIPPTASEVQLTEMRKAFFAGAHHLFASIMIMLEPGQEATKKDMDRLDMIHRELESFVKELNREYGKL